MVNYLRSHYCFIGGVSPKCTFNSWESRGCWYQCPFWLSNWVYWAHGRSLLYKYFFDFFFLPVLPVTVINLLTCLTGWERWNMGMASDKQIVQLAPSGCSNWEKDHLYAWWHWKIHKSCGTNREYSASNYNGSGLNSSHWLVVVSALT